MKKWELEKKLFNFPKKKGIIGFDFSYSLISQFLEIVRNGNLGVKVRGYYFSKFFKIRIFSVIFSSRFPSFEIIFDQ